MEKQMGKLSVPNKKQNKTNTDKEDKKGRDKAENDKKQVRQEQFDNNRDIKTEKKPFDKKTYRLKKYSKKYKLDQWEEQRKKKLLREFYKDVKEDPSSGTYKPKSFDEDTTDAPTEFGRYVRHPDLIEKENAKSQQKPKDPFQKAKEHYNKVKEEKLLKRQAIEEAKEESRKKLENYKKQKQIRFKKLSKKNKKGQPMMAGRMELLLEKIQNS